MRMVVNAVVAQQPIQPKPVITGFVTRDHPHRLAHLALGAIDLWIFIRRLRLLDVNDRNIIALVATV